MSTRTSNIPPPLLVGASTDPHVEAVVRVLDSLSCPVVVLDAATLCETDFVFEPDRISVRTVDGTLDLPSWPIRGWLRRVAPPEWHEGIVLGSRDAVVKTSWLELLRALLDNKSIQWLTPPSVGAIAENKLIQYEAGLALGLPVPRTVVASSIAEIRTRLGNSFIIKCLGPSEFRDETEVPFAVFAQEVSAQELEAAQILGAPFLAQEVVTATEHLRVVTVGDQAWVAGLDAGGYPLDWRRAEDAHYSFRVSEAPKVADAAVRLTKHLGVHYSSQDWIVGPDGPMFLDLNPGGQWLFLPRELAEAITEAVAGWLAGQNDLLLT